MDRTSRTRDQRGASAVEYALLGAFVAVIIFSAVLVFGIHVRSLFESVCGGGSPFIC